MNLTSLDTLFLETIQDIYDAESRIAAALPKFAGAARDPELRQAFEHHLKETHGQVDRLHRVFEIVGASPDGTRCEAAQGLIEEGDEVVQSAGEPAVKDAALIGAAQRVEHHEMAAYGTARALAEKLNLDEAASLLSATLDEEAAADSTLTRIAGGGFFSKGINEDARQATA